MDWNQFAIVVGVVVCASILICYMASVLREAVKELRKHRKAMEEEQRKPTYQQKQLRAELFWFAIEMEQRLKANDHKTGWRGHTLTSLVQRVRDETTELEDAINSMDWLTTVKEAADVANFAMMVASNAFLDEMASNGTLSPFDEKEKPNAD